MEIKDKVNRSKDRFYITTNSGDAELLYEVSDNVMSIYHTFVPETERGKGIAETITMAAFKYAIKNGFKIKPDCTYARHFLVAHKEMEKYAL